MRVLQKVVMLIWLVSCVHGIRCNVGEIVWNQVMQRNEGRTMALDCAITWPSANQRFCKRYSLSHSFVVIFMMAFIIMLYQIKHELWALILRVGKNLLRFFKFYQKAPLRIFKINLRFY